MQQGHQKFACFTTTNNAFSMCCMLSKCTFFILTYLCDVHQPFEKTNQACEQKGKLTIYIIETTKELVNWPELLKSRLVLFSVNYLRNV